MRPVFFGCYKLKSAYSVLSFNRQRYAWQLPVASLAVLLAGLLASSSHAAERLAPCDVLTGGALVGDGQLLVAGTRGQLLSKALTQHEDGCEFAANNGWQSLADLGAEQGQSWTGLFKVQPQNHLWLTGQREALYQSLNGGKSWTQRYFSADSDYALMSVLASTYRNQYYYAVGTRGLYLLSEDQGHSWHSQELYIDPEWEEPEDFNLNAIVELKPEGLLVAGEAGALYWSNDGDDWDKDNAGYNGTWFGALALDNGAVIAFGFAGHVAYAKAYKEDWQLKQSPGKANFFAALKLANGKVLLAGDKGQLWSWQPNTEEFVAIETGTQAIITSLLSSNDELLMITDQGLKRIALSELP